MKTRNSLVSNSSSTSFLILTTSELHTKIINEYFDSVTDRIIDREKLTKMITAFCHNAEFKPFGRDNLIKYHRIRGKDCNIEVSDLVHDIFSNVNDDTPTSDIVDLAYNMLNRYEEMFTKYQKDHPDGDVFIETEHF